MKTLVRLSTLGVLALLLAVPLSAQNMDWSTVGSAGIIDEDSLSLFAFTAFDLEFKAGQTGTITARYPVRHVGDPTPIWSNLTVGTRGPGVTVQLIQASECIPVETVICTLGPSTSSGHDCDVCLFSTPLDFVNNAYYIKATLTRTSTATNPKLHMVSLE